MATHSPCYTVRVSYTGEGDSDGLTQPHGEVCPGQYQLPAVSDDTSHRLGQKTYKPEFFGVLRSTREREVALQDVLTWQNSIGAMGGDDAAESSDAPPRAYPGLMMRSVMLLDMLPVLSRGERRAGLPSESAAGLW